MKMTLTHSLLKIIPKLCLLGLLNASVIAASNNFFQKNSAAADSPQNLAIGVEVEREIQGSETHLYKISAAENHCARLIVWQKGIDVVIEVKNSVGVVVSKIDRPNGSIGRETTTFIAEQTGDYFIEIKTYDSDFITNSYSILLESLSPPAETDEKRIRAEKLTSEGEVLRGKGTENFSRQAISKFQQALTIWNELKDFYEQAVVNYGLGWTYIQLGIYGEATLHFARALKIVQTANDEFAETINYAGIGWAEFYSGNFDTAKFNFKQAAEIARRNNYVSQIGKTLFGLGNIANMRGDYAEAFDLLQECIRFRRLINAKSAENLTYITLAKVLLKQNKSTEALEYLNRALIYFRNSANQRGEGDAQNTLAWTHLSLGEEAKALENFEQALVIERRIGDKAGTVNSLRGLSLLHAKLNEFQKAETEVKELFSILESLRGATLDGGTRIAFTAFLQDYFDDGIAVLMQMHERQPNSGYAQTAFELSERSRSRSLLDQINQKQARYRLKIEPVLLEREQSVRAELLDNLVRVQENSSAQINSAELKIRRLKIQELLFSLREIEQKINSLESSQRNPAGEPTLSLAEIQKYLDSNTVLLEYSLGAERSFLWLVTREKIFAYQLPKREFIEKLAAEMRDSLIRQKSGSLNSEKIFDSKAARLGQILLAPILPQLKNQRLLIVPQGSLQYIPFAALPKRGKPLLADHEIVYLPSGSLIAALRQRSKANFEREIAVFADPVFSIDDARLGKFSSVNKRSTEKTQRLFSSRFEAENIASFVPKDKSRTYLDANASRENIFEIGLKQFRILHFATHAFIDNEEPELSAIMLSNYDENGRKINGSLRSAEILNLNLETEMVVLSGCRTAVGKNVRGEGLLGLSHSFLSAGTSRLLVSLWEVEDKATAELMTRFYRKHLSEKMPVTAALRSAQIEIMNDKRWRSPFFWSSFVLQGDWK